MTALSAFISTLMMTLTQKFDSRDKGATAVEYGIMVAAIAAVIIVTVFLIGDEVLAAFNVVLAELTA